MKMISVKGKDDKKITVITGWDDAISLRIPGTNMFVDPYTSMTELFYAAGYKTFDTALPQPWVNQWNKDHNTKEYTVPKGVWCYDDGFSTFGKFVGIEEALEKIGEIVRCELKSKHLQRHLELAS